MRHSMKLLLLTACVALTLSPWTAHATDDPKEIDLRKSLKNIDESLNKFARSIDDLNNFMANLSISVIRTGNDLAEAKAEIKSLKERVAKLENDQAGGRKAFAEGPPAPVPAVGTILLENRNATWTATILVNGTPYTVLPLTAKKLEKMPAGAFVYTVSGLSATGLTATLQPPVNATLNANTTYTITVNDR